MRLLTFLPFYASILFSAGMLMPVSTPPTGSGLQVASLESYPACWRILRYNHYEREHYYVTLELERTPPHIPMSPAWHRAVYDGTFEVAWAPARGDSFDIASGYEIRRFARVAGPTVGLEYQASSQSLIMALMDAPDSVTGEAIDCPPPSGRPPVGR